MKKKYIYLLSIIIAGLLLQGCYSESNEEELSTKQTISIDSSFVPVVTNPKYPRWSGKTIYFDEAHNNYFSISNKFKPFAELLKADGYKTKPLHLKFKKGTLNRDDILIIADPLNPINVNRWIIPNPSAYSKNEINYLNKWVKDGGSLLLIAGHMPFAGASSDLAASFGFKFYNGYAKDTTGKFPSMFYKFNSTLASNSLTKNIDSIETFLGQGFDIPPNAISIIRLNANYVIFMPDTAGVFRVATPTRKIDNGVQGAVLKYGKGKIAVFGDEAMFTAQIILPDNIKIGMNHSSAVNNKELILNIIHWLDK